MNYLKVEVRYKDRINALRSELTRALNTASRDKYKRSKDFFGWVEAERDTLSMFLDQWLNFDHDQRSCAVLFTLWDAHLWKNVKQGMFGIAKIFPITILQDTLDHFNDLGEIFQNDFTSIAPTIDFDETISRFAVSIERGIYTDKCRYPGIEPYFATFSVAPSAIAILSFDVLRKQLQKLKGVVDHDPASLQEGRKHPTHIGLS